MSHYFELLEDVPEEFESGEGDCGDEEVVGFPVEWLRR
jgi:hypothetical protein